MWIRYNTEKSIIKEKLSYPELMSSASKLINEENDATDLENYCYDLICVVLEMESWIF